jgi:hypothetical protein
VIALEQLLADLLDAVPLSAGDEAAGIRVDVDELVLVLPVETQFAPDRTLRASAPRGRTATGFDPPHGTIHVAFARRAG